MDDKAGDMRTGEVIPITMPTLPPREEYQARLERIWQTGRVTNGTMVREIEELLADYIGDTHCVATANCTIGLILALKALGLDGAVILPSFTFFATAHSLIWNGLEPVFADIDEQTLNISPSSVRSILEERKDISAIMAVHIFGNPCQVAELGTLARRHNVKIVYDSAHALGAESNGAKTGTFGDVEVFSLSPTKPLVAGEGGIISTSDEELAMVLRYARDYGNEGDYDPRFIGLNARLSEFHAALALGSFDLLESNIIKRNALVMRYKNQLNAVPGIEFQEVSTNNRSTFKDFTILVEPREYGMSRDVLSWWLMQQQIETRKYYYPPVHKTKAYWDRWGVLFDSRLPVTNRVSLRILALPIWSHMDSCIVDKVSEVVASAHWNAEEICARFAECTVPQ